VHAKVLHENMKTPLLRPSSTLVDNNKTARNEILCEAL
jgi:hypothetical protein